MSSSFSALPIIKIEREKDVVEVVEVLEKQELPAEIEQPEETPKQDPEPKKQKAKKAADLNRPVPRIGWPKRWYGIKLAWKKNKLRQKFRPDWIPVIPKMTKSDAQKYRIDLLVQRIGQASVSRQRIVATLNSKGGAGKTPLTALLALLLQAIIGDPVLGIDANENAGNLNGWYGIPETSTLQLPEAIQYRDSLNNYMKIAQTTNRHKVYKGRMIASNVSTNGTYDFTMDEYVDFIGIVKRSFHSLFIDSGNGFRHASNMGSVIKANCLIFPAVADKPDSFVGLVKTMHQYINLGYGPKVTNSLIVINAVKPGQTKEYFLNEISKYAAEESVVVHDHGTTKTVHLTNEMLRITEDNLFLVPYSEFLHRIKAVSLEPEDIGFETFEALLRILDAMFARELVFPEIRTTHQAENPQPYSVNQGATHENER